MFLITLFAALFVSATVHAQIPEFNGHAPELRQTVEPTILHTPDGDVRLGPLDKPLLHNDGTGEPFYFMPKDQAIARPELNLRVYPHGNGLGQGRDRSGRSFQPQCSGFGC
jgi:hypothetical protein